MPPLSARSLARHLRSLDIGERAAFVADLWTARGYETRVVGSVVITEPGLDGTRQRIAADPAATDEPVDSVVALDGSTIRHDTDVQVLEAEAIRRMLLYAVDRETAERLLQAYFDRPLDEPESALGRKRSPAPASSRAPPVAIGAALLIVFVAIGVPGGTLPLGGGGPSIESAPVPLEDTETGSPENSPTPVVSPEGDRPRGGGDLFRYPPGLGPSGVTNASALADAHRATLAATAWELNVRHNRSHDLVHPFIRWRTAEQTIVRANATRYRFEVTGDASLEDGSVAKISYVDYGDGSANNRRLIGLHGNAYERTRLPRIESAGLFATVSAAYVRRYLSTTETRVEPVRVENTTRTQVVATGTPRAMARTVANYTAVAVVDRRGVVRELTLTYTLLERTPDPTPNGIATPYASPRDVSTEPVGTVRFTMRFAPVKAAGLTAPSWYDEAQNATNDTGLGPWPNDPAV